VIELSKGGERVSTEVFELEAAYRGCQVASLKTWQKQGAEEAYSMAA
jgi:hypothetical protein